MATGRLVDWFDTYRERTREPATVALATVPLVLLYGLGLLAASPAARSGVDLISSHLLAKVPTPTYIGLQLAIATTLVFFALFRRRASMRAHVAWTGPILAEAVAWGFVLGAIVLFCLAKVHILGGPEPAPDAALIDRAVLAAGAGLNEEFIFRFLLVPILAVGLARLLGVARPYALVAAAVLSSLAFSAAHHWAGEPFDTFTFAYRSVAGLVFASLFLTRGFAIAAWSHAAYDFHVLTS